MKHLLASLVTAGLMVGVAIAQEEDNITSVTSQLSGKDTSCHPNCANPGPQGPGAVKGDHHIFAPARESSSSESHEHDTSTEKRWPPVAY